MFPVAGCPLQPVYEDTVWLIVNCSAFDVALAPFVTLTCAVPAEARSPAGTAAVNWVLLINVVCKAVPFHCTTDPGTGTWSELKLGTKPVPFTVSVNAPPPTVALLGAMEVIDTAPTEA